MVSKIEYYNNEEIVEWYWSSDHVLMKKNPFWTSCYLIDGILIDCVAPASAEEFKEFIISRNKIQKIEKCIITHTHEDHIGCVDLIKSNFNIPVYALDELSVSILKKGYIYPDYRQMAWGEKLIPLKTKIITAPIISSSGKYSFDLFPMPGHAPELFALIEKKQEWAFVTDGVMPKYKMIFGGTSNIQENIQGIYQSIKKLYNYTEGMENLQLFLTGHGCFKGREFLMEKMKELETIHIEVHKLEKQGLKTRKILKKIFGGESATGILTRYELSCINLIKSLLEWPL
ncbi:MAG: MBL fold metallo-hydrolase [archaeon]|nr:MBL fold metallo-hydrolase [archaeon]